MSKSQLTLYNTVLNPSKNWIVEDLEKYLATLEDPYNVGTVRYIEPKLAQTIVLKGSSQDLSGLGYNYAKVVTTEDYGTHTEYYFVQSLEWASRKSIKVNMLMDTLNTLGVSMIDKMNAQTSIIREHQDRWRKGGGTNLLAIVDKYDEGINVAKDTLQSRVLIEDDLDFYCQYSVNATTSNTTDMHPHKCLIATSTDMYWESGGSTAGSWNIPQDASGNIYTMLEGYVQANTGVVKGYYIGTDTITENGQTGVLRAIRVNNRRMQLLYYTGDQFPYAFLKKVDHETSKASTDVIAAFNARRLYYETYDAGVWETMFGLDRIPFQNYDEMNTGYYLAHIVRGIDSVDRTYSGLMQINPVLSIAKTKDTCKFIEGYNLLLPLTYTSTIVTNATFTTNVRGYTTPSYSDNYVWENESKLLHSSITDATIRYQDVSIFNVDFSRLHGQLTLTVKQQLSGECTNLVRYHTDVDGYTYAAWSDYYSYATNKYNVPLYTNQWTEYMRNGYNYDVAERARQKRLQGWSLATGIISGVAGLAGVASGTIAPIYKAAKPMIDTFKETYDDISNEYAEAWFHNIRSSKGEIHDYSNRERRAMAATQAADDALKKGQETFKGLGTANALWHNNATNAANSIINSVSAINSSNAQYQQNIANKSQSRTTINGGTTDYTLAIDNNLDYQVWQPEGYVQRNIAKVFYLTGYSHPVQEKPNVESRAWFNYVQCNPVYDDTYISTINPLWVADYNSRMAEGVTVFHHVTATTADAEWDFDQSHENWEMSLMS